ncbi:high mobility group box domain-containing protein, partial [Mycena filopes]
TESPHIPRPRNAFICFRSNYVQAQKTLVAEPKSLEQTAMSCSAGEAWRKMNEEQRQPYVLQALAEKAAHALKYPEYRYAPKK